MKDSAPITIKYAQDNKLIKFLGSIFKRKPKWIATLEEKNWISITITSL